MAVGGWGVSVGSGRGVTRSASKHKPTNRLISQPTAAHLVHGQQQVRDDEGHGDGGPAEPGVEEGKGQGAEPHKPGSKRLRRKREGGRS
jgi:hypothetical protein